MKALTVAETSWILAEQIQRPSISFLTYEQGVWLKKEEDFLKRRVAAGVGIDTSVIFHRLVAFLRLMNQGVPNKIAYKTVFGPDIHDEHNHEDLTLDYDDGFEGVTFFAVMPRALQVLNPLQERVRRKEDLIIPSDWLNWTWERKGLSRVSIQTADTLPSWVDLVKVYGGVAKIVAVIAASGGDEIREEKTPTLGIDLLSPEMLFQIKRPSGRKGVDFFRLGDLLVDTQHVLDLAEVLSLKEFRNTFAKALPLFAS